MYQRASRMRLRDRQPNRSTIRTAFDENPVASPRRTVAAKWSCFGRTRFRRETDQIEARATGVESVTLSVLTAFTTHWQMPRMNRLNQAFPSVDLRFQLISGRIGEPLVDVDPGMRFMTQDEIGANSGSA